MFDEYYRNRRVLVTGHTGFKGAWLSLWLARILGARVTGFSLPPPTDPSLYGLIGNDVFDDEYCEDIRDSAALKGALKATAPDVVFHLAAQALVRKSYREPLETLSTNVMGTAILLEAVRELELPCNIVVVTSDKCYKNREWVHGYRETDRLGGRDVYSMSKAATELTVEAWRRSFFTVSERLGHLATVRGGNVLGGGDFSEDRILPDCYRALAENRPIHVRNPNAVRPWQHVLDCLSGYLWLGARLSREPEGSPLASAFNFGPNAESLRTVRSLVEKILCIWPGVMSVDEAASERPHEAGLLALDTGKARTVLDWYPVWSFDTTVFKTMEWYRQFTAGPRIEIPELCMTQIEAFQQDARNQDAAWSR